MFFVRSPRLGAGTPYIIVLLFAACLPAAAAPGFASAPVAQASQTDAAAGPEVREKTAPPKPALNMSAKRPSGTAAKRASTSPTAKSGSKTGQPAKTAAIPKKTRPITSGTGFPVSRAALVPPEAGARLPIAQTWRPLMTRLKEDGIEDAYLQALFGRMGDSYSHMPMGTKINELYVRKFMPRPPRAKKPATGPAVYKSMVTPGNVERCREYLLRNAVAFGAMEAAFPVPRETVAALLMVETRLGAFLGSNSALWSLACLAAADSPERVQPTLSVLEMTPERLEWAQKILRERSGWAYKELLALVRHSKDNGLDPLAMPGSVYGAIGLCQFMPTNLPKFAVDGDKDGRIDLFDPADAIPSVANYLAAHGWKKGDRAAQHKALMRYNKSRVYANTILALGDAIAAPLEPAAAAKNALEAAHPARDKKKAVTKTATGKKKSVQAGQKTKKAAAGNPATRTKAPSKKAAPSG